MPLTKSEKIWMDGTLVDWDDANVHILTHSLHYGLGVFEGIRTYETSQGPAVFRLTPHIKRLFDSARIFMLDIPYSVDDLVEATKETVRVNALSSCYVRPLVYLGEEGLRHGVRMKVSSWQRHHPNALPPAAKGTGMYINSSLAKVEALKAGYDEAILLNPQGFVSECTGENLFVVQDGRILTPPVSAGALAGITQQCVEAIATDLGFDYEVANLLRSDLYTADEAFLSGTAAEVVPIRSVDDRVIGDPGEMTRKLQETYFAAVRGQVEQYRDWCEDVG
jgi:branched-chain amino acid aminotransferase